MSNQEVSKVVVIDLDAAPRIEMENGRGEVVRLVNPRSTGSETLDLHLNRLAPGGQRGRQHLHTRADNVYIIRKGTVELRLKDETRRLTADQIVFIPAGVEHSLSNVSDEICELFEIYAPAGKAFDVVNLD
jgi:mannose-6-phosphate isomerase-like protein (cupin superfamily)